MGVHLLERVKDEEQSFSAARLKTELTSEETRLKGIARDQESQARSLVYELKAQKFPKAGEMDRLVKEFISDYNYFVTWRRMSWESIMTLGEASPEMKKEERNFESSYQDKLSAIRGLKQTE